jgi:purine-binding chemotaxis protein CheW
VDWILQIIAIPEITKIPKTPHFVRGVINLRGKIIPVMDLRLRFKLPEQAYNERTSIVIIKIKTERVEVFIGIIVDKVIEVLDIHANEIEQTPTFGVDLDTQFILGMAKVKGKVVSLLNISEILTGIDLSHPALTK